MIIKAKRVENRPGWVSFKLSVCNTVKCTTKEKLIKLLKTKKMEE